MTSWGVFNKRGSGYVPLIRREQEDIGTGRIHLVALARMNRFLLHCFDLKRFEFLVKDLAQIHYDTLVDFSAKDGLGKSGLD